MANRERPHQPVDLTLQGLVDLERIDEDSVRLIRRREHSLLSLLELTNELSVSLDPYEIADLVLFNLMGHLGTSKSAIWLLSKQDQAEAVTLRAYGVNQKKADRLGCDCGIHVAQLIAEHEAPLTCDEITSQLSPSGRRALEESGLTLLAPVFSRTSLVGFVGLGARLSGELYGPVDKQILQSSLGAFGVALENTRLYTNLRENNRQLALAYDQLKENDRLKSQFLRNVNHELRTPLTVILAAVQWLLAEESDASKMRFLETISKEGSKLNKLLERLLDLSAVARNGLEVNIQEIELAPFLEQFYLERHLGVAEGLRELRYAVKSRLPRVRTDPIRLRQILEAFVDNAIKFTPEGSRIRLAANQADPEPGSIPPVVRVEVRDNGPGIPEAKMARLFVTFEQGDGSTSRARGGLGLGLPFAHEIAERMGAKVGVESAPGAGSTFSIVLPIVESPGD